MRSSGTGQILVRGDGANLGWFVIEKVNEKSSYLTAQGIGRRLEFDMTLTCTDPASPAAYVASLFACRSKRSASSTRARCWIS